MCFIPRKVTIKIAIEDKKTQFSLMCKVLIVSSAQVKKQSKSLVRWFLYHS